MKPLVTVVDPNDIVIDYMTKEDAITGGFIRRLVKVILFTTREIFLQKRAFDTFSYPGLYDTAAGGHVDQGEEYDEAAKRELLEELGVKDINLTLLDKSYSEHLNGDILMRAFVATYSGEITKRDFKFNAEVAGGKWLLLADLKKELITNSQVYTPGCRLALDLFFKAYRP